MLKLIFDSRAAVTVKSDLLQMALRNSLSNEVYSYTFQEDIGDFCTFLASLLHKRVLAFFLPLSHVPFNAQVDSEIEKLLEAIGAKCAGLRELYCTNYEELQETYYYQQSLMLLTEGSQVGVAFFKTLPRLSRLQLVQLPYFKCDDWALQQFAQHAPNLRYKIELKIW